MIWDPWVIFDIPIHPNPEKFDFEPALTKKIVTQKRHFLPFFCLWLYFFDISVQKRPLKPIFFGKLVKFPIICHQKHVHTTKLLSTRLFSQKWNFTRPIPQTVSYADLLIQNHRRLGDFPGDLGSNREIFWEILGSNREILCSYKTFI